MDEAGVAVVNEAGIRCRRTLINVEKKRIRTIPNILRRKSNGESFGRANDNNNSIKSAANLPETSVKREFEEKAVPSTGGKMKRDDGMKLVGKNGKRRKQEIRLKDIPEDYSDAESEEADADDDFSPFREDPSTCELSFTSQRSDDQGIFSLSQSSDHLGVNFESQDSDDYKLYFPSQQSNDEEVDLGNQQFIDDYVHSESQRVYDDKVLSDGQHYYDHKVNLASQPVDDHEVPSTNQLLQCSLDLCFDYNTNWLDIQSMLEVNLEPEGANKNDSLVSEIKEEKLDKVSDSQKKEAKNGNISTQLSLQCCWICGKTYKSKSSLRYHQRRIHDFKNRIVDPSIVLTCNWCSKKYRRVSAYEKHLNKHLTEDKKSSASFF